MKRQLNKLINSMATVSRGRLFVSGVMLGIIIHAFVLIAFDLVKAIIK